MDDQSPTEHVATGAHPARLFGAARVARLATADAAGRPHLVPIVFAVAGDTIYSAVDAKPKGTRELRRLANARENPAVAVLADQYDEDWTRLWWVRADLRWEDDPSPARVDGLAARLARTVPQYADRPFHRVLVLRVVGVTGWAAGGG